MPTPLSALFKTNPIPPRGPDDPTKVYSGGCHCGKFTFELQHPLLEEGFEVIACNCSICVQRGFLFIYTTDPKAHFKLTKGEYADLTRYTFHRNIITHMFCPVCGCGIFEEIATEGTLHCVGVNVRTIPGLDLAALTLRKFDGLAE